MNKYLGNSNGKYRPKLFTDAASIKLILLVMMLVIVIFCMIKARNPETWAWMGFENESEKIDKKEQTGQRKGAEKFFSDADVTVVPAIPPQAADKTAEKIDVDPAFKIQLANLDQKIESVEQDFWQQIFDRLNEDQKREFYSLLRFAGGETTAESKEIESYRMLVTGIHRWRQRYEGQLLEHVTSIPNDEEIQKKAWNEILFRVQKNWSDDFKPGLSARLDGQNVSESHRAALLRVRQSFLQPALAAIVDSTPVARPKDAVAWLLVWEQLQAADLSRVAGGDVSSVTQVELSSQPSRFRGEWVQIEGSVRAAQRKPLKNHMLGFEQFYVLWIRPADGATIPICVYALNLPAQFPPVQEKMTNFDELIKVTGVFFKVRSYEANGGWRECPLVLCDSFSWMPKKTAVTSRRGKIPSLPWMVSALAVMGVLSGAFAFWVYRTTSTRRYRSEAEEKRIAGVVQDLASNPDVKTVGERLQEMAIQQSKAKDP